MEKYISKYSGERMDHSVGVIPDGDPSEASVIVYSGVDADGNPISIYKKASEVGATVVQETGEATDKVMSQKIVTDSLNNKVNYNELSALTQEQVDSLF